MPRGRAYNSVLWEQESVQQAQTLHNGESMFIWLVSGGINSFLIACLVPLAALRQSEIIIERLLTRR